jgi:peroxiredoxin
MTWVIFDEADHYSPAPNFCLPSTQGKTVCLRDYYEDCNIVLIFTHGTGCDSCLEILKSFALRRVDYLEEDAITLAILPEPLETIQTDPLLSALPILLLSDPLGATRQAYAGLMAEGVVPAESSMLFVLDRYSAPYTALIDRELDGAAVHQEVKSWLFYIGIQCPE